MHLLEQILVAVDLGPQSDNVLATASELAKKFGSKVVLLHVLVPLGAHPPGEERYASLARQAATERLHQLRMHLEHEKVSTEEVLVEGVAFGQIISHAETYNTNVIVVGSGAGAGGSRLGITAERVCRKALKPVWVVSTGGSGFPRSILCPVDFSKPAERALRNAIHLARSYAAELTVLTVIVPPSGVFAWFGSDDERWRQEESSWCESQLADFLRSFDFHSVTCQKLVRCGDPAEQILAVAAVHLRALHEPDVPQRPHRPGRLVVNLADGVRGVRSRGDRKMDSAAMGCRTSSHDNAEPTAHRPTAVLGPIARP